MCDGVYLRQPNGEGICIPIYVDLRFEWPPDDDGWKDLHILATINQLVTQLGAEDVRGQLAETLQSSAQAVVGHLPGSFELGDAFMANTHQASSGD